MALPQRSFMLISVSGRVSCWRLGYEFSTGSATQLFRRRESTPGLKSSVRCYMALSSGVFCRREDMAGSSPKLLRREGMAGLTPASRALPSPSSYPPLLHASPFSSTPSRNGRGRPKVDRRITLIRYFLSHPRTPRPLRFSRLRTMRHWTIHRAAQLHHHSQRQAHERALERQYNAIRAAMEELRVGVAAQDGGRLYRQATQRQGLMGGLKVGLSDEGVFKMVPNGGVPLEYARAQVDGPSRKGWDHGWVRS